MNREPNPVRDYVRTNLRRHTREAIRQELVAAGHDPSHVDAVWQEEWQAASVAGTRVSLTTLGVILFIVGGVVGALGALLIAGLGGTTNGSATPLFLLLYAVVYLALGYGILRLVGWVVLRFGIAGWLGVLLGVLLFPAYGVLMFGGCLATYGIAAQVTR